MLPILIDRVAWSVGLSVCHTSEPCKTGCTDRAAIWFEDLGGPGEPRIRWGSRSPHGKGQIFGGEWASHCIVQGHSMVVCAKTAEPIGMPFGLWARMGRRNRVRWGSIGAEGRCHGNQFWDEICYNWLWRLMALVM